MVILVAGGGSGGHITPALSVLKELKKQDSKLAMHFITDRKFARQARGMIEKSGLNISTRKIYAGKIRRYHGVSVWRHLLDIPTLLKNLRDVFLVGVGFLQSVYLIKRIHPDVIFTKGGFVCLPVGLAAKMLGVPLVIHDSDTHPGLTNRVLAKFASSIATGASKELYPYKPDITFETGIPVEPSCKPTGQREKQKLKAELDFVDTTKPLVVVTGGGLGARSLNSVVVSISKKILQHANILHITGQDNYREVIDKAADHPDYIIVPFVTDGMAKAFCAADVVVSRAGATTIQELAAAAKPTILVPSPYLTAGHQLKNAKQLGDAGAAIVLAEDSIILRPLVLYKAIEKVLDDKKLQLKLGKAIYGFAKPNAAIDVASLIVDAAARHKR